MRQRESEDLVAYSERLRSYSVEELEDIYFSIHILRHPVRYRLLMRELEARRMRPAATAPEGSRASLVDRIGQAPLLRGRPAARALATAVALFAVAALVCGALFVPFWLFAVPFRFTGIQADIVYVACAPVPPLVGAAAARQAGGRGWYLVFALLGVLAATWGLAQTSVPSVVAQALRDTHGGAGWSGPAW